MKLEFSMAVKAVPNAEVHCCIECTEAELSVMLSDPVYKELGSALVAKLQAQPNQDRHQADHRKANGNRPQPNQPDRFDSLRRYLEADIKQLQTADRITNRRIDTLSKRIDQLFDFVTKMR